MKTLEEIQELLPSADFLGMYSDPRVNRGAPVPVFASRPPADCQPSINTLDGWSAFANKTNRRSFVATFGREPVDDAEMYTWVESLKT